MGKVSHTPIIDLDKSYGVDIEDMLVSELSKSINAEIIKKIFELGKTHTEKVKDIISGCQK